MEFLYKGHCVLDGILSDASFVRERMAYQKTCMFRDGLLLFWRASSKDALNIGW